MLEGRKAALLDAIVSEHIRTAQPVGSKFLVGKRGLSVSPATLRNDMAALEDEGYLTHPHTSAGRVPTPKGYRYYVDHCVAEKLLTKTHRERLHRRSPSPQDDERRFVKELARTVADIAHEAILVGFTRDDVYYTGLSYVLSQPEFADPALAVTLSQILDHLDETMSDLFADDTDDVAVTIGEENPFGNDTSLVVVRYGADEPHIFGILGPTRMDYAENIALAKYVRELMMHHTYD